MRIKSKLELIEQLKYGQFAFPGGYQRYFVSKDSSCICYDCLVPKGRVDQETDIEERAIDAIDNPGSDKSWEVFYVDINWENGLLICDECNKRIPSAYAG
jgi:hypothetical protein